MKLVIVAIDLVMGYVGHFYLMKFSECPKGFTNLRLTASVASNIFSMKDKYAMHM